MRIRLNAAFGVVIETLCLFVYCLSVWKHGTEPVLCFMAEGHGTLVMLSDAGKEETYVCGLVKEPGLQLHTCVAR